MTKDFGVIGGGSPLEFGDDGIGVLGGDAEFVVDSVDLFWGEHAFFTLAEFESHEAGDLVVELPVNTGFFVHGSLKAG